MANVAQVGQGYIALAPLRGPSEAQHFILIFKAPVGEDEQSYLPVDSTTILAIRSSSCVQRALSNIFDLYGKVYSILPNTVTLEEISYSVVGPTGPWLATTVLTGDPSYSFPSTGSASGNSFQIPFQIDPPVDYPAIWIRIKVSY